MAKYLIDGATLTAIADGIRRFTRTEQGYDIPQSITPEEMPDYIEVNVADSNYDRGYSEGIRTLQGSLVFKQYLSDFGMNGTYTLPAGIYTSFYDDAGAWSESGIERIAVIGGDSIWFYSRDGYAKYLAFEDGWYSGNDSEYNNPRFMYVNIPEPVQVSQDVYNILQRLISTDNDGAFGLGYDEGYAEASKPNLTNVTYDIPSGWTATAGYGTFNVNGTVTYTLNGKVTTSEFTRIRIGKHPGYPAANYIEFSAVSASYLQSTDAFTITFTGGADVTNTSLINWLDANGRPSNSLDLEALGTLCDWQITTDSNSWPVITIVNYHPSYYLHCAIYDEAGSSMYDPDTDIYFDGVSVVVPPNSSRSVAFDDSFSYIKPLYIDNVRWKASAT